MQLASAFVNARVSAHVALDAEASAAAWVRTSEGCGMIIIVSIRSRFRSWRNAYAALPCVYSDGSEMISIEKHGWLGRAYLEAARTGEAFLAVATLIPGGRGSLGRDSVSPNSRGARHWHRLPRILRVRSSVGIHASGHLCPTHRLVRMLGVGWLSVGIL